jgi:hypothetical protein
MAIGGTIAGGPTVGSVLFVGTPGVLAQDNANLFWDDTNNRLGLGTATPSVSLDIARATGNAEVYVASADTGGFTEILLSQATTGTGSFVDIYADGSGDAQIILAPDSGIGGAAYLTANGGDLIVYAGTNNTISMGNSPLGANDITMKNAGVGIGLSFDADGTATGSPGTYLATVGINKSVGSHDAFLHINNTAGAAISINKSLRIDNSGSEMLSVLKAGHLKLAELSTTPTDVVGFGHFFAKTDSKLYWRNGAGTEFTLTNVPQQESVTTQNIVGTDTVLTDVLNFTPVSNASVMLFLNGAFQRQGVGFDYTISGTAITWLAASGTALDMSVADTLIAVYTS